MRVLLSLVLVVFALPGWTVTPPLAVEREPAFGEVSYLYWQGGYFAALTRADIALGRGEVKHARNDLKLLMGVLYSLYGMSEEGEAIFASLPRISANNKVVQQAWLHLSTLYYRQGDYHRALATLDERFPAPPEMLADEYLRLRAKILMQLGRFDEAAATFEAVAEPSASDPYLRYNLAISQVKGAHPSRGVDGLWQLANLPAGDPENNAIKDKAIQALVIYRLRHGQLPEALTLLSAARVDGPFADDAMQLYVQALLMDHQPLNAVPVLQRLQRGSIQRRAVQDALLALPMLYADMGDRKKARIGFEAAIERLSRLDTRLADAQTRIADGGWFRERMGEPAWSTAMDLPSGIKPPRLAGAEVLYDRLVSRSFHRGWAQFHELNRLQNLLLRWQQKTPVLYSVLETHAEKAQLARIAEGFLQSHSAPQLQARLAQLQRTFEQAVEDQDPLSFATNEERRLWQVQQEADTLTEAWGAKARPDMSEKLAFYRGVLLWDMQEDLEDRQSERQRDLGVLQQLLEEHRGLRSRVQEAANNVESQAHLRGELEALERLLADLRQRADTLIQRQQFALQSAALASLTETRARLKRLTAVAHESLADLMNLSLREKRPAKASLGGRDAKEGRAQ